MDTIKNGVTGLFALLIEAAPKLDASTRSAFWFGEPTYPEAKDFE